MKGLLAAVVSTIVFVWPGWMGYLTIALRSGRANDRSALVGLEDTPVWATSPGGCQPTLACG